MILAEPGFADPVSEAQACFRTVLDAMSRPGTLHRIAAHPAGPLDPATAAVLLTLLDPDTGVWLDPPLAAARDWIAFHCGAPAAPLSAAAFAVACTMPDLRDLPAGSDDAPQDGATLILQVAALGAADDRGTGLRLNGTGLRLNGTGLRLSGPGLRSPAVLHVTGLPDDFPAQWHDNHRRFPRGVDLILCAGAQLAALPRSVAIVAA